jgi:hypothetical protein
MIFYKKGDSSPYHLAVVQEIMGDDKEMQVIVVQSAGLEKGLEKFDWGKMTPQKTSAGDLYAQKLIPGVADTTLYFAAGPPKGKSNV